MTDAIGAAVEERLFPVKPSLLRRAQSSVEEIFELACSLNLRAINDKATDDEIPGYGPEDLCE